MRDRLISVAIQQFGEHGFAGASTRDIARHADTTMSNITYHFGGKDGLYRAAAEAIVAKFQDVSMVRGGVPLPENASREQRIALICEILRAIGSFMLSDEAAPLARFVAREQQDPDSVMREYFSRDIQPMCRMLEAKVALIRPDLDAKEVTASVFFLLSMAISLRSSRLSLCIAMDVPEIDGATSELLLARLDAMAREVLEAKR